MRLILASASPRRAELLRTAGFIFDVAAVDIDETPHPDEHPQAYAARVARDKARLAWERCRKSGILLIAADTVVAVDTEILAKPEDHQDAERMLKRLSGRVHDVFTAVVLMSERGEASEVVPTRVRLLPLTDAEINWYIASGEPFGKAGAYGIQGRAARFIDWIEGSWSNVVGLPIATVYRMMSEAGFGGILTRIPSPASPYDS
jgi:septum formation protein